MVKSEYLINKKVVLNGEVFTFDKFQMGQRAGSYCLWVTRPEQLGMEKVEHIGGYPNEACIFWDNLTEYEKKNIKDTDGNILEISE